MIVGTGSFGAALSRLLEDSRSERVIVIDKPKLDAPAVFPYANRKERRSYSSKKKHLKGLRP